MLKINVLLILRYSSTFIGYQRALYNPVFMPQLGLISFNGLPRAHDLVWCSGPMSSDISLRLV